MQILPQPYTAPVPTMPIKYTKVKHLRISADPITTRPTLRSPVVTPPPHDAHRRLLRKRRQLNRAGLVRILVVRPRAASTEGAVVVLCALEGDAHDRRLAARAREGGGLAVARGVRARVAAGQVVPGAGGAARVWVHRGRGQVRDEVVVEVAAL